MHTVTILENERIQNMLGCFIVTPQVNARDAEIESREAVSMIILGGDLVIITLHECKPD